MPYDGYYCRLTISYAIVHHRVHLYCLSSNPIEDTCGIQVRRPDAKKGPIEGRLEHAERPRDPGVGKPTGGTGSASMRTSITFGVGGYVRKEASTNLKTGRHQQGVLVNF